MAWTGYNGYVYSEELDAMIPVDNSSHVYYIPSEKFSLLAELAIRVIFREKGVEPEYFTPSSAPHVKPVVELN